MLYSSVENSRIKGYKKLHSKKYRDEEGLFFVEGEHLIQEAYKTKALSVLILKEGIKFDLDVETIYVSDVVMKYLSNLETIPTMIGICKKQTAGEIKGNVVLLEDIQDPGNLGTIIRSAVAFNIDTIILSKSSVDPYNEKVIRATQGLIFHINIIIGDLKEAISTLKHQKYDIIGTTVNNEKQSNIVRKNSKYALLLGNEGSGISLDTSNICDELVYINMNDKCESLNVAVAASIILYELDKQV